MTSATHYSKFDSISELFPRTWLTSAFLLNAYSKNHAIRPKSPREKRDTQDIHLNNKHTSWVSFFSQSQAGTRDLLAPDFGYVHSFYEEFQAQTGTRGLLAIRYCLLSGRNHKFQSQTGTRGLLALEHAQWGDWRGSNPRSPGPQPGALPLSYSHHRMFQAQTGTRGLLACHPSTLAPEAKKRKHLRESLFRRAFQGEK
jgi:hypothetical protein